MKETNYGSIELNLYQRASKLMIDFFQFCCLRSQVPFSSRQQLCTTLDIDSVPTRMTHHYTDGFFS
jgi:hypothetical protein